MDEREFHLEERKALLIRVRAIEEMYQTKTITLTLKREEAAKLNLLDSPKT